MTLYTHAAWKEWLVLYQIHIIPESYPYVLRPCAKCGRLMPFYPANEIRINAQKKLLDVWLVHHCQRCGQTWNLELFSRVLEQLPKT